MLQIRKEQMQVLESHMHARFVEDLTTHVIREFPKECEKFSLREDNIAEAIEGWLRKARNYEIDYVDELTFFVDCNLLLEPDFDTHVDYKWARDVLADTDLTGTEKMGEINDHLLFGVEEPM